MTKEIEKVTGIVLIHGAGLGGWIWNGVAPSLNSPYVAIDFPSRGEPKASRQRLALGDYVRESLQQIEGLKTPRLVIVAHSLGGVVGLEIADKLGKRVAGFVAVSAAIPRPNDSFISVLPFPKRLIMVAMLRAAGTKPPESAIRQGLCSDLDSEIAEQVVKRYTAESLRVYTDKITVSPPRVPSLYIRSTNDKEFGPDLQSAMAQNLNSAEILDMDSGHMPMLSQPKVLANHINDFIKKLAS